ncbi:DUF397 domain-containing protein [Actinomadura sp. NEAU-AAG7]|uniref:DUF397 domain-containing protein n=1 Tax=Actinomadura sp. NEAU-AAG7 TaxID=2839640 RepID=UPI001BE4E033|nr:DUF397 domain-containing protein [Actinomadura sp. NEAU-AAG7]MBT2207424.1 DUF397 domain-containing protein [Actinomadura sp. NEAU-AAG7]
MELRDLAWRKASRSTNNGGDCVEVAGAPSGVAVRDSKDPGGPRLLLSRDGFRRLAEVVRGASGV